MPPSKTKKNSEESPEERRSKRRRINEDDEEEEKERDPISKGPPSKKAQLQSGGSSHKPAELFRKDLISAMKLADSEPLNSEDYILISDSWRQEWERGVQVPVNEISIPAVVITKVEDKNRLPGDFKISKKYLHSTKDETYQLGIHELTGLAQLAEQVVRYDLDDLDVNWLQEVNSEREVVGLSCILEWTMERVIESLETQCHENMELKKKTEEGLGIEYDMDIVCEICQSPNSEDTNEMVFCDGCDICVHQACYGITTVPEGSWLCRTCALGIKPQCILCPKIGGAMKSTRSGTKWSHVSCAIWIPEVNIGCAEKMEPITKISQIPASRWALICCICKERCGACIQCSVKSCKTAFHVTCAFTEKLEMKTILVEDKHSEDVKMKGYCPKHSRKRDRNSSESDSDSPRKSNPGSPVKEMTEEEKATMRADRLKLLEDEFYTLVEIPEIAKQLELEQEVVDKVFDYWKLKRKALMYNRPLLTPKTEEADLLEKQQEDSLVARMKMFVHLRQDLERVRNLSYMISKREKMKKQFSLSRESVFYAALEVLTDKHLNISKREVEKIVKQYKDIPDPYCNFRKKAKLFPSQSTVKKVKESVNVAEGDNCIKPEGDTSDRLLSPGDVGGEGDSVSKSLNSNTSLDSETSKVDMTAKSETKPVKSETKPIKSESKTVKSDGKAVKSEGKTVKGEPKAKKALLQTQSTKKSGNKTVTDSDTVASVSDIDKDCNDSAMDTSELIDVETADDTLVNTSVLSQASSADTLTPSETEPNKDTPNTQTAKRGRKRKSMTVKSEHDLSVQDVAKKIKKEETNSDIKPVKRSRGRPRKIPIGTEDVKDESEGKNSDSIKSDNKPSIDVETASTVRERRQSAPFKMNEEEKAKLVNTYPSAKNVSDQIKAELNGYFKNNKLVVSNKIKQKVQNSLLNSKRRNRFSNGIIIDHSQKKIDNFFAKSPPTCDPAAPKSPTKSVSRVLNELSPTRDRFEANNIERTRRLSGKIAEFQLQTRSPRNSPGVTSPDSSPDRRSTRSNCSSPSISSVKEKLFDSSPRPSRKGRGSSPDSVKSFSSLKLEHAENDRGRIRTRSLTPSGKDLFESEFMDTENLFDTKRRKLRNSHADGREGSRSPQSLLKSHTSS